MKALLDIVVRSVGERTESVCVGLIERYLKNTGSIVVLREPTHADAVEATLRVGVESEAKWLVAVDADMLLHPDAYELIAKELSEISDDTVVVHFAIFDKLYLIRRWGVTVYRQAACKEILDAFAAVRRAGVLKIESEAIKEIVKRGGNASFSRSVVALHDYEQYYRDLYRKVYLNTIRNPGYNKRAPKMWQRLSMADKDYRVMLKAFQDAKVEKRKLTNSVADFKKEELDSIVRNLELEEKAALDWNAYVDSCIEASHLSSIAEHGNEKVFYDYFEKPEGLLRTWFQGIRNILVKNALYNRLQRGLGTGS